MTKKFGFTLAEVLITLGIIGVVAAMTIPTLIANTNSAKFGSQFKKTLSTLGQAGLMAQAQYDLDYALVSGTCAGSNDNPDSNSTFCAIFNATLSGATYVPLLTDLKAKDGANYDIQRDDGLTDPDADAYSGYVLADGSLIAFRGLARNCTLPIGTTVESFLATNEGKYCVGFIDVNGVTPPNKTVKCGGTASTALRTANNTCGVPKDATHTTDIYPVVFHDTTVEPASNAAMAVLSGRTAGSGSGS